MPPTLIASDIRELLPMQRTPGNHVSEIINRLAVKMGLWEESGPASQIQYEMGNAVEDLVAKSLADRFARDNPDRYVHGLEMEKDGLYGTLDLLDCVDFAVEDVKMTKKSIRHAIESEKYWHNWVQVMCYCHMIGSTIGRLHVVYVNGNYKYPGEKGFDPLFSGWQYRVWEERFTEKQLTDNWRMILGHRRINGK